MPRGALYLAAIGFLAACAPQISPFSPIAYEQATALKVATSVSCL